jgi:prevent-host-death family protein
VQASDYNGYMIMNLRGSKAKLSMLVERAAAGEEVVITVRGKPRAKLTGMGETPHPIPDRRWADELRMLQKKYSRWPRGRSRSVLDDLREDRFE